MGLAVTDTGKPPPKVGNPIVRRTDVRAATLGITDTGKPILEIGKPPVRRTHVRAATLGITHVGKPTLRNPQKAESMAVYTKNLTLRAGLTTKLSKKISARIAP